MKEPRIKSQESSKKNQESSKKIQELRVENQGLRFLILSIGTGFFMLSLVEVSPFFMVME